MEILYLFFIHGFIQKKRRKTAWKFFGKQLNVFWIAFIV